MSTCDIVQLAWVNDENGADVCGRAKACVIQGNLLRRSVMIRALCCFNVAAVPFETCSCMLHPVSGGQLRGPAACPRGRSPTTTSGPARKLKREIRSLPR